MLQAANTDFLAHYSLKLTIVSDKIYNFLSNLASKIYLNQFHPAGPFLAPN